MSNRWPGGLIRKTPVIPTATSAVGVWTLAEAAYWQKQGLWPSPGDPLFDYVTMLLPGNGTNGAQNNTFLDSSSNNFTVTRNGNTTQGSFSPYGDLWSNYFDGSGDYLSAGSNAAFALGTGNFTIECWAYFNASTNAQSLIATDATNGFYLAYDAGYLSFGQRGVGSFISVARTPPVGVWEHYVVVRSGTTLSLYANGVRIGTATNSYNFTVTGPLVVGALPAASGYYVNGYISNARVVKGTAVYDPTQTTLSVPTAPVTAISGTSLLTCQSNRFRDASANNFAITVNGNTSVTNFAPFNPTAAYDPAVNGGSGYFDGSGDYLSAADSTALVMGTSQFWFEAWIYMPSAPATEYIVLGTASSTAFSNALTVRIRPNALRVDRQVYAAYDSSAVTWQYNAWQHIAVGRDAGDTLRFFVNGQAVGTRASTTDTFAGNSSAIGLTPIDNQPATAFRGYISNARLLKGQCLYTSNFTPPTAPLTAITNTSLLLNFTNAGIVDASAKNDLETVGNAQISTAQSKFGGSSMYFDGTGDRLISSPNTAMDLSSGDFTIECWIYSNNISSIPTICYRGDSAPLTSTNQLQWHIYRNSSTITFSAYFSGTNQNLNLGTIAANTWYHIAVTRSGSIFRGFLNGVQAAQTINTTATLNNNTAWPGIVVGLRNDQGVDWPWNGYIDDLRVTKGVARYTSNFTPPTAAFLLK